MILRQQNTQILSLREFAENLLGWTLEPAQIRLLESAGRRVILNCTRQWGKSTLAAAAILHHALQTPQALVLIVGPSQRQSAELLHKVRALARQLGLTVKSDGINRHAAVLRSARIVALPASANTIRGFTRVTFLVIDEASMVRDEIYDAVRPMLTQNDGAIWLLSTPNGPHGFFYREWALGEEDWDRTAARADESPRFTPQQLAAERASLGDRRFNQEFLCQFVTLDGALFDAAWLENLFVSQEPIQLP